MRYLNNLKNEVQVFDRNIDYSYKKNILLNKNDKIFKDEKLFSSLTNKCITELFETQARMRPNYKAVTYKDQVLTYKQLIVLSKNLSKYLRNLGVSEDECVGIFLDPSVDLMIGVWGILFSGNAYLPLSTEYPEDRLKYMIEDSGAKFIFSDETLKNRLLSIIPDGVSIITSSDFEDFRLLIDDACFDQHTSINDKTLAYVIYTSGSTGKPKGVMIERHSIVNQMLWLKKEYGLNDKSIVLQKTPISFDAAQWEILSVSCGCHVVMGESDIYKNPFKLIEAINNYKVTTLQCVPTLLQALVDREDFYSCKSLRQVFSGGESLSKNLAFDFLSGFSHCQLVNLYGPTECTINSSSYMVTLENIKLFDKTIPIGFPIDNTQYHILDESLNPISLINEIGELYIGGDGLARGYLNRIELTKDRFVNNYFCEKSKSDRLYKTGDLVCWRSDGSVQYVGRIDNQVKLRGYRIELDEIKYSIETHDWVKNASIILKEDDSSGCQSLIAFVELDPKEASLMDQGNHDSHHQSKESKSQVIMQLSNKGFIDEKYVKDKLIIDLPHFTPSEKHIDKVFSRKTYRYFEGEKINKSDILNLLNGNNKGNFKSKLKNFSYDNFGEVLRYFGQFISKERLLPKYGYASPGALYPTQMYFELNNVGSLPSGYYYYHPANHQLVLINKAKSSLETEFKIHYIGKNSAIEPIYKNNIQEVLEIEAGHMIGLFDNVLSDYGLSISEDNYTPEVKEVLEVENDDFYLGTFKIISGTTDEIESNGLDIYVQINYGKTLDIKPGLYAYNNKDLEWVSSEVILKKQVIAINQEVYDRACFGISVVSNNNNSWLSYISLGRKLQELQMNDINIGLMSSGYSSKTGNDLPSARRIQDILRRKVGASYFFIGGRVSDEQKVSRGMQEDLVHMKGPAEMIRDELVQCMPTYMVPNKVVILNALPLTVNGKVDVSALKNMPIDFVKREFVLPRNSLEENLCQIWKVELRNNSISITDNFFEIGGNSLVAVCLIHSMSQKFNINLPVQALFEAPTIERMAERILNSGTNIFSRLVLLQEKGEGSPIYCWPGLGGYCMNLKALAKGVSIDRPFYGVQAFGLNQEEAPYSSIQEMAREDIKLIKKNQPYGPYALWGYSFGAKLVLEVAYQLEKLGDEVESVCLIAPGSPQLGSGIENTDTRRADFNNKVYLTLLFSVFVGKISGKELDECLDIVNDKESFIKFISAINSCMEVELIDRIINLVSITYEFNLNEYYLSDKKINSPIKIIESEGDSKYFVENIINLNISNNITIINSVFDHYKILHSFKF